MTDQKIINRRQGAVIALNIELMANQKRMLDEYSERFNMKKSDIIAQALNMWFGNMGKGA